MKILLIVIMIFSSGFIGGIYVRDHQYKPAREYQIRLEIDSAYLYDGNRLVGSCGYEDGDGSKGKTHWVITYTTKTGMKASCHR